MTQRQGSGLCGFDMCCDYGGVVYFDRDGAYRPEWMREHLVEMAKRQGVSVHTLMRVGSDPPECRCLCHRERGD